MTSSPLFFSASLSHNFIIRGNKATLFSCFATFLKEVYFKRKEFAPYGSKFFPFSVDPFSEGTQFAGKQRNHKSCLTCQKNGRIFFFFFFFYVCVCVASLLK